MSFDLQYPRHQRLSDAQTKVQVGRRSQFFQDRPTYSLGLGVGTVKRIRELTHVRLTTDYTQATRVAIVQRHFPKHDTL